MTRERRESNCQHILSSISAYLDGDLDPRRCDAIETHCVGCPSCKAVVDGLREAVGLCRQAAGAPLPDAVRARARAQVQRLLESDLIERP